MCGIRHLPAFNKNMIQELPEMPKLVIHPTYDAIFYAHWNFEGDMTFEELLKCPMGEGDEELGTLADMLEMTKENGFWAYSDFPRQTIHVWFPMEIDDETRLMVLGHEIGHLLERHGSNDEIEHEHDADNYGIAAVFAHRMLRIISEEQK